MQQTLGNDWHNWNPNKDETEDPATPDKLAGPLQQMAEEGQRARRVQGIEEEPDGCRQELTECAATARKTGFHSSATANEAGRKTGTAQT